ncbi:MAG: hypothetical protein KME31_31890 [Tolypothrix carrinoi HA7290-LM1]|jgi:hypothetical protein|nr:hypothetical protein [Tolypothrix carrinoi HA7290-LM1]
MTDYIKRIQSRLSHKDIKKSRAVLLEEVSSLGYNHENLTSDLADLITAKLLDKFSVVEVPLPSVAKSDSLLQPIPQPLRCENLVNEPGINEILQPDSYEEESSEIVISSEQKQDLVASQASALGIELSEVEVVDLATGIKDSFLDHECFIESVVEAIVTYHDHRSNKLEQKIKDAREHIEFRRKQLNQTLVGEFGEMNNFFRSQSAKQRELSKIIAAAFKT